MRKEVCSVDQKTMKAKRKSNNVSEDIRTGDNNC